MTEAMRHHCGQNGLPNEPSCVHKLGQFRRLEEGRPRSKDGFQFDRLTNFSRRCSAPGAPGERSGLSAEEGRKDRLSERSDADPKQRGLDARPDLASAGGGAGADLRVPPLQTDHEGPAKVDAKVERTSRMRDAAFAERRASISARHANFLGNPPRTDGFDSTRFRQNAILDHHREAVCTPLPGSPLPPLSELHPVEESRDPHEGADGGSEGEVHRSRVRVRAVRGDDEGQAKPGAREAGIAFPASSLESTS